MIHETIKVRVIFDYNGNDPKSRTASIVWTKNGEWSDKGWHMTYREKSNSDKVRLTRQFLEVREHIQAHRYPVSIEINDCIADSDYENFNFIQLIGYVANILR